MPERPYGPLHGCLADGRPARPWRLRGHRGCLARRDGGAKGGDHALSAADFALPALKRGLALARSIGVNPFQFGLIGSTDPTPGLPAPRKTAVVVPNGSGMARMRRGPIAGPAPPNRERLERGQIWGITDLTDVGG